MLKKRIFIFLMLLLVPFFPSKVKAASCEIASFSAFPNVIYASSYLTPGQVSNLTWLTTGCSYVELVNPNQSIGMGTAVSLEGTAEVGPFSYTYPNTKDYTLVAYGDTGQVSLSLTIYLTQYPANCEITSFRSDSYQINAGASTNLSWNSTNCNSLYLNGILVSSNGSQGISPQTDTTYMLSDNQGRSRSLTVAVAQNTGCSLVYFGSEPNYIDEFGNASVTWSISGDCAVSLRGPGYLDQGEPDYGTHNITNASEGDTWTLSFGSFSHSIVLQRHVNCSINSFSASSFDPGAQTNISILTSACDHAVVSGGNFGNGLDVSNRLVAGHFQITDTPQTTTTYTLFAWSSRNEALSATAIAHENVSRCSVGISRRINSPTETSFNEQEYVVEVFGITSLVISANDNRENRLDSLECNTAYFFAPRNNHVDVSVNQRTGFKATSTQVSITTEANSVLQVVIPYRTDAKLEIY